MTETSAARLDPPVVGLIVNPIAGLGGRVGLKGTDGPDIVERAIALGAQPEAGTRAAVAIGRLVEAWHGVRPVRFLVGAGPMGETSAIDAGIEAEVIGGAIAATGDALVATSAADTRRLARHLAAFPVDLLLVAGGDGTARDVARTVGLRLAVLGIPAGVKIQSATFATSPRAAGELAAAFLASSHRRTEEREVLDLDERAYRRGEVAPRLHGYLRVPAGPTVQGRKSPAIPDDAFAAEAIAADVVGAMLPGRRYVLGPGTTVRAIAERLGLPKTLVGIDVVEISAGGPRLVSADVGERELVDLLAEGPATIIVTPVGGQGSLLGRGNQPLSARVLRAAGRDPLLVVATPRKLAALGGRPLLVDTGDPELDRALEGHVRVITGARDVAIVPISAA